MMLRLIGSYKFCLLSTFSSFCSRTFKMIPELPEVWLKHDTSRTLARCVGAYLVCDLFPSFDGELNAFWCGPSSNFFSTVSPSTLNCTVAIVLICISFLGLYTTLFAIGVYVLYINCTGPIRWPFLIAIVVMYSLATA